MAVRNISVVISANTSQYIAGLKRAQSATKQFNQTVQSTAPGARQAAQAQDQYAGSIRNVERGMSAALNAKQRYTGALRIGERATAAMSGQTSLLGKGMATIKAVSMEAVGALIGFSAIHAVITSVTKAFKFATDAVVGFDKAMVESLAIIPKVSAATEKALADQARLISSQTKFSPAEVAEGYYFLLSAGLDTSESIKSIGTAAEFAQAGVMDLEEATEILLDTQTALGLRFREDPEKFAREMKHVADVITKAAIDSNATVEQVSESFTNRFATMLSLSKRSVEEGAAIIEMYAAIGIKGKVAGQQAYIALRDLQRGATENAVAMRKYGIEVYDAQGNVRNLVDIQEQLNKAFKGMSGRQQREALKEIGLPDRSVAALLPWIASSSKDVRAFYDGAKKSYGMTEKVAQKQMESIANAMSKAQNVVSGFFTTFTKMGKSIAATLIDTIGPAFSSTVKNIQEFVKEFAIPALKPFVGFLGGAFLVTLKAVGAAFGAITFALKALGPLAGPLIALITAMKLGNMAVNGFAKGFGLVSKEVTHLKAGLSGLGSQRISRSMLEGAGGTIGDFDPKKLGIGAQTVAGYKNARAAGLGFTKSTVAGMKAAGTSTRQFVSTFSGGMGGMASSAMMAITAIAGVVTAYKQFQSEAKSMGQQWAELIDEKVDKSTIKGREDAIKGYQDAIKAVEATRKSATSAKNKSFWEKANPFFDVFTNDAATQQKKALEESQAAERKAIKNAQENYKILAKETGLGVAEVQKMAESKGMDFFESVNNQKSKDARKDFKTDMKEVGEAALGAGFSMEEAAGMTEDASNEMVESANKINDAFKGALQEIVDPTKIVSSINAVFEAAASGYGASFSSAFGKVQEEAKEAASKTAEAEVKSYNDNLEKRISSLKDTRDKIKKGASDATIDGLDAQIDSLEKAKKAKEDFLSDDNVTASTGAFLKRLTAEADNAKKFTDGLLTIRERLAKNGVGSALSDEIITQLASLGAEGLPIIESFVSASESQFHKMSEALTESVKKMNPNLSPTWQEVKTRIAEAKTQVSEIGVALVGLSGNAGVANAGITTDQLKKFASLGPEFQSMLVTMFRELNAGEVGGQEIADGIKSILDAKDFGQGKIPEAINEAMVLAHGNAVGGTAGIMEAITSGIAAKVPEVKALLDSLGLGDVANILGIATAPQGGAGGGGVPAKPRTSNPRSGSKSSTPGGMQRSNKYNNVQGYTGFVKNGKPVLRIPGVFQYAYHPRGLTLGTEWYDTERRMWRAAGLYANGGIEQHSAQINKGGIRVWSEPETGGEAYIPLASSKRSRSTSILAEVANQFGYSLTKFANGGLYGTAGASMVGGGAFGTSHAQAAQTVVVPVSTTNQTNFNGPIQGVNMEDALRFAERKKRQRRLTR